VGISVALIGGKGWEAADDWGALAACGVIVFNAVGILRVALHDALDGTVAAEVIDALNTTAGATPGVESTEKCRVRTSGVHLLVDIHARVDPDLSVREGHTISHELKARLMAEHPRVSDVVVHLEPAPRPAAAAAPGEGQTLP
jgi:divalent metal cation (Fe/Co/Zn/Cd) transporter